MQYKLFKLQSKAYPEFMHEIDESNPMFIGILSFPLNRIQLTSPQEAFLSSPIKVLKETDLGYYVETNNSIYELRRV